MNIAGLLLLFMVAICAIFGVIMISSQHSTPFVDSYNQTFDNQTNATQTLVTNMSATGGQVGSGMIILIALVIGAVIMLALAYSSAKRF